MGRHALMWTLAVLLAVTLAPGRVQGHGRLVQPPSRSSMWRYGFNTPPNYEDNQLFCGGFQLQYERNGGKCGVCGDPWNGPLDNEPGGKYASGIIVAKYRRGQAIDVKVELTASHKGWFEFRLCSNNLPLKKITHECLDRHLLTVAGTRKTRIPIVDAVYRSQMIDVKLQLPEDVTCTACVLQWKYNAGNSWGVDPQTGQGCIGCGNQEQFYGCADIAIGHEEVQVGKKPERHPWHTETDSEKESGHWGIVGPVSNTTFGAASSLGSASLLVTLMVAMVPTVAAFLWTAV